MNFLKSKTILFGSLLTIFSMIQMFVPFFPSEYMGIAGATIGAIVIGLRYITNVPLNQK